MPLNGKLTWMAVSILYLVGCTNPLGSDSVAPDDFQPGLGTVVSPSNLSYASSPFTWTRFSAITSQVPSSLGDPIASCTSNPTLPTGLSLSNQCIISGAPTSVVTTNVFTITATNTGGSTSTTISITVNDVAPAGLNYTSSPYTFTRNTLIASLTPTSTGGNIDSCSANPTLPTGLSISSSCVISGTPSVIQSSTSYVVTATNTIGSTNTTIVITVNDILPSISYSPSTFSLSRDIAITTITPSNSGGPVTNCSSTPALPAGLSLSSACVITGTPTATQGSTSYNINASNSGGAQSAVSISIEVIQTLSAFTETFSFGTANTDYTISTNTLEYLVTGLRHKSLSVDADNTTVGFSGALVNTNTIWNSTNSVMQLSPAGLTARTGNFESRIFSAPAATTWTEISWISRLPSGKSLPNNKATETAFAVDNMNMTGNELLLHFDEASWSGAAGEVLDSSGNNLHGTITASVTQTTSAKFGKGALIPNTDDRYISIPHNANLDSSTNMSWEAWIYPTNVDGNPRPILSKRQTTSAANNAYAFFIFTGGRMTIDIAGTGANQRFDTGYTFSANTWYHVAATFEGALGSNRLKFYVNGALASQHQPTATSIPATDAAAPFRVGSLVGNTNTFRGTIDEVAVYSRVLSLSEITSRYNRGARRIKLQARHCNNSNCSDGTFVGPDGTAATFFTENSNTSNSQTTTFNVASLFTNRQYFQYRAVFESDNSVLNPQLSSVSIKPDLYDSGYPTVINNTPFNFVTLASFTPNTVGTGEVRYQISRDGTNWFYWNSAWTAATLGFTHSNSAADINTNISTFPTAVGQGNFYFRAFYNSGVSAILPATLNSISVTGQR